jgi:predicted small lipoprotein YifL
MKTFSVLLAVTSAFSLVACGSAKGPAPEATASATISTATTPATPVVAASAGSAAFTAGQAPSKEFMVGTWGEGDACEMPINFQAGGTILDGPFAKWDILDGHLVMEGAPQKLRLEVVDERTMKATMEGADKVRTLKRC